MSRFTTLVSNVSQARWIVLSLYVAVGVYFALFGVVLIFESSELLTVRFIEEAWGITHQALGALYLFGAACIVIDHWIIVRLTPFVIQFFWFTQRVGATWDTASRWTNVVSGGAFVIFLLIVLIAIYIGESVIREQR